MPIGIFAGWIAGAAMSRRIVRREVERLEFLIGSKADRAAAAPAPAPAIAAPAPAIPAPGPEPAEPAIAEEISPEIIMVLSAAVAAFLGKRARIRGARLVRTAPSSAWAQQGRVFVQASHNLGVVHGR